MVQPGPTGPRDPALSASRETRPRPEDPHPSRASRRSSGSGRLGGLGGLGWFLCVSFLLNFGQGVYPPLLPELVGELGLSLAAAGLLGTAFSLPRSLLALPAGMLLERLGATRMMHAGMALILAGTLVAAGASSLATMRKSSSSFVLYVAIESVRPSITLRRESVVESCTTGSYGKPAIA